MNTLAAEKQFLFSDKSGRNYSFTMSYSDIIENINTFSEYEDTIADLSDFLEYANIGDSIELSNSENVFASNKPKPY
jgi:hypothetical protein